MKEKLKSFSQKAEINNKLFFKIKILEVEKNVESINDTARDYYELIYILLDKLILISYFYQFI